MKHNVCETLEPRHDLKIAVENAFHSWILFMLRIGIFKTFGFLSSVLLSVTILESLRGLQGALLIQNLTIGEYVASVISLMTMLLLVCYYEFYYIDSVIKDLMLPR
jgi:hypothetical protein